MYLEILNDIYPVYNILNDIEGSKWLLLDESKKSQFTKNMDLYFNKVEKGESYNNYPNDLLENFFIYMMTFFDTKYNFLTDIKDYIKVEKMSSIDTIDDYDKIKEKNIEDYFSNYKLIDKFYLYDFIRSQILKISNSWYGYKIFRDNKIVKLEEYQYNNSKYSQKYDLNKFKSISNVSYKNIYNFSKSLYYFKKITYENLRKNKYLPLTIPTNYNSLNISIKNDLTNILTTVSSIYNLKYRVINDIDNEIIILILQNFNITNNLQIKYSENNYSKTVRQQINILIIANIFNSITDIVFECLCKRGLLSEYIIRRDEFEKNNLNQNKNEIIRKNYQILFENHLKKYENAYYYLTDNRYKDLKKITNDKGISESYFKTLTNDNVWYNYYAMDWVSQINFYHHYINQRVTMLTGGTGVGKSTQTPKLLLYGLKAFDKRFKGKVICTEPRIAPTTGNAQRISFELGVPIINYSTIYKQDVKTTNGYIQYKYEKGSHIDEDQEFFLRIVTDGSLLNEIKNSPLLKKMYNEKRNNIMDDDINKIYSLKNLYDIIIVDESHEHNANMDMILTMIRNSVFLNNQLRLYIISATMDSDDPIYRKYYRCINDNLLYPIRDTYNSYNATYDLLDRCVIDRRIHISPPGETTQYKINEIYHTEELDEKESYKLAIKYALDICINNSAINNDILLFCTTSNNIIKLVDELNAVLPGDTLAIPFYKNLPEDSKSLIGSRLNLLKKKFKFERKYIHDVLNNKKKADDVNSNYKYDRILIVSTNIAEASITINSLKFVIDTGFNLDVSFNYETNTDNIEVIKISEASRLQRKGRVGRVGDGSVYYTYPKNARLNIKPSYNICKINFSDIFLNLMEEAPVNEESYIANLYPYLKDSKYEEIKEDHLDKLRDLLENDTNYSKLNYESFKLLMYSQYYTTQVISQKICFLDKLNNVNLIGLNEYSILTSVTSSGIRAISLIDKELNFYIIHPFENKFETYRNKNTRILDDKHFSKKDIIYEYITDNIVKKLQQNLYAFIINKEIYKTKIVEYLNKLKQKTNNKLLNLNLFYPIIVGHKLNVFDNVLFILYFLINTQYNILNIVDDLEKFNKIFMNKESDLLVINNIFELFKTTYSHILFDKNIEITVDKSYDDFKKDFYNYKNNNIRLIKHANYNDLIDIIQKNDDLDKLKERLSEKISPKKIPDYINIEINNWCLNYGINYKSFINILNDYYKQYINFKYIIEKPSNTLFLDSLLIDNELTKNKNIIKSFIYGNMTNIFIYEDKQYKNIQNYDLKINYKKNSFKKKWISSVIDIRFKLVLNLENDKINDTSFNDDDETNNQTVILNILSNIDNKMYSNILYVFDNPNEETFYKLNNIEHNFICNNPINIDKNKHKLDPNLNEYINILQSKMKDYIDKQC